MITEVAKPMLEQTFASLAILKVNADQKGKDYIDYFIPFVMECVCASEQSEISGPDLQSAIRKEFGIEIPQSALATILSRAATKGYVAKVHNTYRRNDNVQYDQNIGAERDRFLRSHSSLLNQLIDFVASKYNTLWNHDQAEKSLFAYLEKNSGPLLATAIKGSPLVAVCTAGDTEEIQGADYLVNAFVEYLHQSDQSGFETLETIVKGRMLADVLLFEDLNVVKKPFKQVEVYFDTPFMLRVLGCSGESLQAPCMELVQLLRHHHAFLRIFERTYDEITGILNKASRALRDPRSIGNRRGESLQYFIKEDLRASDIDLLISELPDRLDKLQIKMKPYPAYRHDLGIDEKLLKETLQQAVSGYKDIDGAMLAHDVDALTAIHRLRVGAVQHRLETCDAIFITSNHSLARASVRFFEEEYNFSKVPHCMLDFVLATLVWLKEPLQLSSDLPRKRIIASCYAALKPDEYLWRKYLDEADSLRARGEISENSLQLAKSSPRILMDITRGSSLPFSEGTVREVINAATEAIRLEEAHKLRAEQSAKDELANERYAQTERELLDMHRQYGEAEQKLKEQSEAKESKIKNIRQASTIFARIVARVAVAILSVLFLVGSWYLVFGYRGFPPGIQWRIALFAVLAIVFLVGVLHAVIGLSITEVGGKIEKSLALSVEAHMRKWRDV